MEHKNITFTVEAINKYIREHNISDFRIEEMKNETLCLVGSFDLSYYHDIKITITGVCHLTINYYFDVDLLNPTPFTVSFLPEDTAVLGFEDWSTQQTGEIYFENNISFTIEHVCYNSHFMSNIIEITDLSIPELDIYARLSEVQLLRYHEPDLGLFICESPKVIVRALDAGYTPLSILAERKEIKGEVLEIIERCGDIPVYTADYETLSQLTGFNLTRGMLCAMRRNPLPSVADVVKNARRIAVLEDVVNPTNVGAIFRSAAALNMDAVLLTPACSNPLYRRAARVSMGTVFQIPWTFLERKTVSSDSNPEPTSVSKQPNTKPTSFSNQPNKKQVLSGADIRQLQEFGFKTAAFALTDDSISIDDPRLMAEEKLAIILGTEGEGLADATIKACDYTVKIPMSHGVDSLNVAAASAVAFWQFGRMEVHMQN